MTRYSIGIVGAGRLGRALLYGLKKAGHSISFIATHQDTSVADLRVDFSETQFTSTFRQLPPADVIFLTVPDDAIGDIASDLAENAPNLRQTIVAHTSGAKSSELLVGLRERGARVASFHPAQSFAGLPDDFQKFPGTTIAIEGDSAAVAVLVAIAHSLGGTPLEIPTAAKPLYHLACVMASNYSTSLMDSALDVLEKIGIPRPKGKVILLPLFQTTARNLEAADPETILTGPIARGDVQTVEAHLENLVKKNPARLATYIALGRETLRLARRVAPQNESRYREMEELFRKIEKEVPPNK